MKELHAMKCSNVLRDQARGKKKYGYVVPQLIIKNVKTASKENWKALRIIKVSEPLRSQN